MTFSQASVCVCVRERERQRQRQRETETERDRERKKEKEGDTHTYAPNQEWTPLTSFLQLMKLRFSYRIESECSTTAY